MSSFIHRPADLCRRHNNVPQHPDIPLTICMAPSVPITLHHLRKSNCSPHAALSRLPRQSEQLLKVCWHCCLIGHLQQDKAGLEQHIA